ncbi:hypothetical protein C6P46_003314, partial [Rhodotorula mucilaginosa]
MAPSVVATKKKGVAKVAPQKFVIDYSGPANDKIFDAAAYEKFLVDHIKVQGKTGQLGDDVKLQREELYHPMGLSRTRADPSAARNAAARPKLVRLPSFFDFSDPIGSGKLSVTSTIPFSKRYLKYLTKRFLKRN